MFKPIPVDVPGVVAFKAVGKLTHDDYQQFLPTLEKIIEEEGEISLLLELESFHGWDLEAAMDDYKFAREYLDKIRRIAIVGDKRWERWLVLMAKPFVDVEVRYFTHDQLEEAWDWVRQVQNEHTDGNPPKPWRRILVPVDFSSHAERAVRRAAQLAQANDAQLTLLHVVEDTVLYDDFYDPIIPIDLEYETNLVEKATERLTRWVEELEIGSPEIQVVLGTPTHTILSTAEARNADLIVMGTHGRKGIARLLGSTTRAVITRARCEVLSVPLPGH